MFTALSEDALTTTRHPSGSQDFGIPRRAFERLAYTALFFGCIHPFSIPGGLSANYAFLILPLVLALLQGRVRNPGDMLMVAIVYYVAVLLVAALYQYDFANESPRRLLSFVIFMSMFSYAFITIDADKVAGFKTAVVCISVYFSISSAYELLSLGNVGFEAKDIVGTQRFGFIYLLAIWLLCLDRQQKKVWRVARYPILAVVLAGLLLTFSRSSIVALLVSVTLFGIVRNGKWLANITLIGLVRALGVLIGLAVMLFLLFTVFPVAFQFFDVRLFEFFANPDSVQAALEDD